MTTRSHLHADGEWKVLHDGGRWWSLPYCVYGPDGRYRECAATLLGARWLIREHRRRIERVVHREKD